MVCDTADGTYAVKAAALQGKVLRYGERVFIQNQYRHAPGRCPESHPFMLPVPGMDTRFLACFQSDSNVEDEVDGAGVSVHAFALV